VTQVWDLGLGAQPLGDGLVRFVVWAPFAEKMAVRILGEPERLVPLDPGERGYYYTVVDELEPGSLYFYQLNDGKELPDPASRWQPQGVHGPSAVVDPSFDWEDDSWSGLLLPNHILYELHVGTYTQEGTFDAVIPHLGELKELGITAVELMPVSQFPGPRNWGYDGVYPFAVQESYGGPEGLKRLVNACHRHGLAVVLDVVYNHLGPEGNYLREFGPYFTDRYQTIWGHALNFDGPQSDEVRRFFIDNALYWTTEFHIDAFRLDAVDHIMDRSPRPFLQELAQSVNGKAQELERPVYCIAESALNDTRLIRPTGQGGYGLDAQWNDEFHHALHTLLTGERRGYYQDYGSLADLMKAFAEGYVYSGQYSTYHQRRHGMSSRDIPASQFMVFRQNHDQVGNRVYGRRLNRLVPFEGIKLAAAVVLLSPYIPLLFMGEEYGEEAPFLYFVSHSDPELIEAVRAGRIEQFAAFNWQEEPPDPQDESTFLRSKLDHRLKRSGQHKVLLEFYRELIRLRTTVPALANMSKEQMEVRDFDEQQVMCVRRWQGDSEVLAVFNFAEEQASVELHIPASHWRKLLDSAHGRWEGPGSGLPEAIDSDRQLALTLAPTAVALFTKEDP
jgi:maltooligosyltrehalose trehalohydrolase